MAYTKTIWSTGDTITATLANHWETQYDAAKADLDAHVAAADPHPQYATDTDLSGHTGRTDNPHGVTAVQVGAVNKAGDTVTGDLILNDGTIVSPEIKMYSTGTGGIHGGIDNHTGQIRFIDRTNNAQRAYVRLSDGEIFTGQNKHWHAGNDGAGSTMDADTVDGKHASDFALASSAAKVATGTYTGDGTANRVISIGFTPILVMVKTTKATSGVYGYEFFHRKGSLPLIETIATSDGATSTNVTSQYVTGNWQGIVTNGFKTGSSTSNSWTNVNGDPFEWIALG
jgi:hypothetical protein